MFFFNDTATTENYPLSLHAALPIFYEAMDSTTRDYGTRRTLARLVERASRLQPRLLVIEDVHWADQDRKSTRLNSSHANISYAVFCLKKNNTIQQILHHTHIPHLIT